MDSSDYIPHCREVIFQDRDEALAAAVQTANAYNGGTVCEYKLGNYVTANVGPYLALVGRWKTEKPAGKKA
jgi:hypothetical protein